MPKEYIGNACYEVYDEAGNKVDHERERAVEVRWHGHDHGGYVSVATLADKTNETDVEGTNGQYVELDREGVNCLIRVLRRARDHGFGKDA